MNCDSVPFYISFLAPRSLTSHYWCNNSTVFFVFGWGFKFQFPVWQCYSQLYMCVYLYRVFVIYLYKYIYIYILQVPVPCHDFFWNPEGPRLNVTHGQASSLSDDDAAAAEPLSLSNWIHRNVCRRCDMWMALNTNLINVDFSALTANELWDIFESKASNGGALAYAVLSRAIKLGCLCSSSLDKSKEGRLKQKKDWLEWTSKFCNAAWAKRYAY